MGRIAEPPAPAWDAEVSALLGSIVAPESDAVAADARLHLAWREGLSAWAGNGLWPTVTARALVSPERWLVTSRTAGFEPYEQWLDRDRGILAAGTRLGRRRPASEGDRGQWAALVGRNQQDFRGYATAKWTAKIDSRDGDLVVVALTAPLPATDRVLVTIDTVKRMLVLQRTFRGDTLVATARWGGVVRAGGLWWATEYTVTDTDGRETYRRTLSVREIPAAEFDTALAAGLAGQDDVIFLGATDPAPADAKQAVHEGRGTFADHLTIAAEHGVVQRWDEAWSAWEKARALVDTAAARRPGADWIEATLLSISRRGERFASQLRALAEAVATRGGPSAHGLARQIDQMAQNGMQANERLELLDVLTHAVDASADTEEIRWQADFWTQQRARTLANSGRQAEAVALWRELWTKRPEDAQLGLNLVYGLANSGDVDGALEFFRALDLTAPASRGWHAQQVYSQVANLLWNAGRFETLGEIADRFIAARPQEAVEAYADGLSALLALGRIEEFDAWVGERLDAANASAEDPIALAQLRAAVQLALGHDRSARWYGNRSDPKWVRPLALLARRLARDEKADTGLLSQIVNDYRWRRTDGHRELLAWLREDLVAAGAIESLPVQRLWNVVTWLAWDRNAVDAALWRGVTDRVKARLAASTEDDKRPSLLATALHLLDAHLEPEEAARVLRDELAVAAPARVPQVANDLATRLLAMPWTQAIEDEAFALVPRLVTAEMKPWQRRSQFATAARWLVDRLLAARAEAALPPHVEREKLPRAELREKQRAARTDARRALASRLAAEAKGADAPLRPWYEIERLGLAAELGAEAQAVEAETRELLLSLPAPGTGGDASNDIVVDEQLTWVLRERCVLVLSYLATRLEVPEGLADRVLALFRERGTKDDKSLDWRYATFRLLVALDRAADLETSLRAWIVPAHVESRWRRALGYLLAETGRVREAAGEFEEVARLGEMSEAEYVSLAGWYLVLGEDARREATLERRYSAVDEYALEQRIYRELNRVQSKGADGVPRTMDDEILRVIRALLAKSSRPEHVLHQVRSLYQSAKDFRLLASLADGVVGHTPQRIYPFLTSAASLVQEIHEEATCDELRARIEERVASARTDTDRRGLGLMMVLVERRAAEVLNQPGPHAGRALEDLKRARRGAWLPGERRLMADFLASLGKIPDAALAAEQASQLTEIHGLETPGTTDRLRVAHALFRTHWAYGRAVEAIDGLTVALEEHRRARGGVLPAEVNDLADALAGWHESHRSFKSGESWLAAEAARQTSRPQQEWYARRTFQLWVRCLQHGGTVSLGSRAELYRAARPVMERALADHAPDRLAEVLASYCGLHRAAHHNAKIAGVGDELVRFSRTLLPEILRRFGQQGDERLREVAEAINEVAGPLAALSLAVERLEQEPAWHGVRGRGYGTWQALSWQIAKWRREAGALGELEPRLLAVALRELERDLVSEEERGRTMFERNSGHFWAEKAGEFARIARKVIEEQPQAPGCVRHTAWYMFHGLGLRDEAERTLEAADGRGALAEDGRFLLVQWYQNEKDKRWRESLPHAERLVRERPDNLAYRIHNVRALHGVGRDDDGRALVDSTRVHFADLQARRQIDPGTSAQLANLCLDCGYFDRAVTLFPEAISERRRAVRGGQGDAELSQHYGGLARTLAGLGRYDEAVDAASSAVVVWGQDMDNRDYALRALRVAIAAIPDLAAWTARWEAAAAASGMDAPVIRLALADLHLDRNEPTQALRHLLVARRHTPDDAAVHAAVVKACEKAKDAEGTCDALATSLHHLPNQPDLYVKLADRLCGLGRTAEAERALTGLAEYAPNEADGHRRLALVRSEAGRHEDAVVQWRQVVRIRPSEVDGWFGLARSLAGAGQRGEAHRVLDDLLGSRWGADRRQDVERVSREIDRD